MRPRTGVRSPSPHEVMPTSKASSVSYASIRFFSTDWKCEAAPAGLAWRRGFIALRAAEAFGGSSTKKGESVTHVSTDHVAKQLPFFSLQSDELK